MSDSVRSHRWQPTRIPRPWDSPGKNTGMGCHFLLQCMKVKSESEVAQSCPSLRDPMDCSLPGSSIHGIFQARVLEWGAIAFSHKTLQLCYKKKHITKLSTHHSISSSPDSKSQQLENLFILTLGHALWLVGSQFPDQGLNPGPQQ